MILYDTLQGKRVTSTGTIDRTQLRLGYQSVPTWEIAFVTVASGATTAVDVSGAVTWKAAVDNNFNHTSEPMCRTLNADIDDSEAEDGIIKVKIDANTATFETAVGAKETIPAYFELQGLDVSGAVIFEARFEIIATNAVDPSGGTPPDPVGNYYTKTEVLALLADEWDVQFSSDNTNWHDTQVEGDVYIRLRPGSGVEWTTGILLPDGPAGEDGAAATIEVGTVTTGAAGSSVIVNNSGTETAAVFDFTIPKGDTGEAGAAGTNAPAVIFQYSADSVSWHSSYTAGDVYIRFSVNGGSTYGDAMQFSSSGVNTPLEFDNDDLTAGVLTVSGLRPIIAVIDDDGKVIQPDEITYGSTDTTIDLTSYGAISGTWTVIFGQGKDGADGANGTNGTNGADGADAPQDNWRVIDTADFTATPSSTSVLLMSDTSAVNIGDGIKYTDGRGTYYAIVTAVTSNTSITIAGAAFDTGSDVTALYVGNNKVIQTAFFISGTYADGTGDLLAADMNTYEKWQGRKAYLVSFSAVHKTADTGAAQPKINVKVNGSAVSTNDSNNGVQLSTAGTWVDNSAVAINTSNYDINRGEAIEINCTAAGTNSNASDLTVSCVFVQE